ncbi:MAG: class I SAM-dependent methyltransferase [Clostridia bacterium]
MKSYGVLSQFYNRLMTDCDYIKWSQYLFSQLNGLKNGVDLACGTGAITKLLVDNGYDCIGIDNSIEMLNIARRNVNTKFVQGDMIDLTLPHKVDFITCVCDGVNYVKEKDIDGFFAKVSNNLALGGKFIFDISSEYKLRNILGDNIFYEDLDDLSYFWRNKLYTNKIKMDLIFFEKLADGNYLRRDETQVQYIYSVDSLVKRLTKIGFSVKTSANYGERLTVKATRVTFVCTKNN